MLDRVYFVGKFAAGVYSVQLTNLLMPNFPHFVQWACEFSATKCLGSRSQIISFAYFNHLPNSKISGTNPDISKQ